MFEAAEVHHKISKATFKAQISQLRVDLLNAQYDLRQADFPVIIVIAGDDRPGCNEILHGLHDIMDARYMLTHALGRPTDEELEHPRFWRFWRALPRRGQIGVFLGAWALDLIRDRILGDIDDAGLARRIEHIRHFEQNLVDDGALLLKFWLHLPRQKLKKRLKRAKKNPEKAWRLDARDLMIYKHYNALMAVAERVVRETSTGGAMWHIVESTDVRYRDLTVGKIIQARLAEQLGMSHSASETRAKAPVVSVNDKLHTILDTVALTPSLRRDTYRTRLQRYQARLSRLTKKAREQGVSSVLVFEGWDAAGKGGVIRRITAAIDPEAYRVIPVAAPTQEEQAHHYLWRFWHHLPRRGRVVIFDRSWYGRVLVERIEGFATESEWQRAYSEINDFEAQLSEHGILLLKFWLHIDPDEQLRRFQTRQALPYKQYKITDEDYRNRDKWHDYELATHDMVAHTSTEYAPWHLVPSKDKRWARIDVLKTYCRNLKRLT